MTEQIARQAKLEQNMEWQLQHARNQFSEAVQKAGLEGPQIIPLRGQVSISVSKTGGDAFLEGVAVINLRDRR